MQKLYKRSAFLKLLIQVTVLLAVVTIIFGIVGFFYMQRSFRKEAYAYNEELMIHVKNNLEHLLEEIQNRSISLVYNTSMQKLLQLEDKDKAILENINEGFIEMTRGSNFIVSGYLYATNLNLVISNNGVIESEIFSDHAFSEEKMKIDYQSEWSKSRVFAFSDVKQQVISYSIKVPLVGENPKGVIVINLDKDMLYKEIIQTDEFSNRKVMVFNSEGDLILGNINRLTEEEKRHLENFLHEQAGYTIVKKNGKDDQFWVHYKSPEKDWHYISLTPYQGVYNRTGTLLKSVGIVCLIGLVLGAVGAFLIAKKNIVPIKRIMKIIRGLSDATIKDEDEWEVIEHSVRELCFENQKIKGQFLENQKLLKEHFLMNLLYGGIDEEYIQNEMAFYGINKSINKVVCCILKSQKKMDRFERYHLKVVCREVMEQFPFGEVLDQGLEQMVLIWGFIIPDDEMNTRNIVKAHGDRLVQAVKDACNIEVILSIGSIRNQFEQLPQSYREALRQTSYQFMLEANEVVMPKALQQTQYGILADFHEKRKQVVNLIKLGKVNKASENAALIIKQLMPIKSVNFQQKYFIFMQMITDLVTVMMDMDVDIDEMFGCKGNPYAEFSELSSLSDIYNWFQLVFDNIENYFEGKNESKAYDFVCSVASYLDEHYKEQLSMDIICDVFDISRSYLSKNFKAVKDMTVLNYLNNIRLREAEKMLLKSSDNLQTVADATGFHNKQNIIRAFKKAYGMTPTEWRENQVKANKSTEE